jgi:hypothetical protein
MKKNEFETSEIQRVQAEHLARLKRQSEYKQGWHERSRAKDIDAFRAKRAESMRAWRAKNRVRAREISRAGSAKYNAENPATRRKSSREYNARRRAETVEFYGGKCVRCGFSDIRALHIDHIDGGGGKIRKEGRHGLFELWKITRDDPVMARATFQLMCANCNSIKRHENYEYKYSAQLRRAAGL